MAQVVRVSEKNLTAQIFELSRRQSFKRSLRTDGHKNGQIDTLPIQMEYAATCT